MNTFSHVYCEHITRLYIYLGMELPDHRVDEGLVLIFLLSFRKTNLEKLKSFVYSFNRCLSSTSYALGGILSPEV